MAYQTSGASETIFVNFFSRSSRAHRAEHARSDGLARIVDQHRGVVVEPDIRAILAPPFFPHPHHDRLHNSSLFDLAFRCCFLYRGGDDVAEARLQSRVAAHRHDAGQLARAPELSATVSQVRI